MSEKNTPEEAPQPSTDASVEGDANVHIDEAPATEVAADTPVVAEEAVAGASGDVAEAVAADADVVATDAHDAAVDAQEAAADAHEAAAEASVAAADAADAASSSSVDDAVARAKAHVAAMADDDDTPWYDREDVTSAADNLPEAVRDDAPATALIPPAEVTESVDEPVAAPAAKSSAQPIFVQAPEPPRKRGNRGFSGVVALIATVIFALGYIATRLFTGADAVGLDQVADRALEILPTPRVWVPIVVFFFAFWLLGAFLNTAKWGYWVIFGIFVGLASMAGHVFGEVVNADITKLTPSDAIALAGQSVATWPALVALVLGRELPVWFGGWIARRGRTVIAANAESQEEYQRTLEAGPQIVSQ